MEIPTIKSMAGLDGLDGLAELAERTLIETGSLASLVPFTHTIAFDHGPYVSFSDVTYKKNLVHRGPGVDIYVICWREGQGSKIHDHPPGGCVMIVLSGELTEKKYQNITETPTFMSMNVVGTGQSAYNCGSEILHQIVASMETVSLHIYQAGYVPKSYEL